MAADSSGTRIDWPALMKHKESFTGPVPLNMEEGLRQAGVRCLHGTARFKGGSTQRIEADLVIHGAGRVPAVDNLNLRAAGVDTERGG